MKHTALRAACLFVALLTALTCAAAALETLSVHFASGVMSWNAMTGADTYYYKVDDLEAETTTALSVNIDAYIDGKIEAGKLKNIAEHDVHVEAYDSVGMETLGTWVDTYAHLHPTLPEYVEPEGPVTKLSSSAAYDSATGMLIWSMYSNLTKYYWYSVNGGPSNHTDGFSVNIHTFINEQISSGDIPYAETFKILLTANKKDGSEQDRWEKTISYTPAIERIDIDDVSTVVNGVKGEYVYTGAPIQPAVTAVFVKGKELAAGTDYAVSYGANTEVGTGTVVIKGKGKYKGTVTITFVIKAKDPDPIDAKIVGGALSWSAYPGATSYSYGVNGYSRTTAALSVGINAYIDELIATAVIENVPSYQVVLEALDSGMSVLQSWTKTYAYASEARIDIAAATVTGIPESVTFTGAPITPTPTVKYGETKLSEGTDYAVGYANNTEVGTASVIIKGKGKYGGALTLPFQITPAPTPTPTATPEPTGTPTDEPTGAPTPTATLTPEPTVAPVSVSLCSVAVKDQVYTGKALKPAPVVKHNGTRLKAGRDYAVSYRNNKNVGQATVTVRGKGHYTGKTSAAFTVAPRAAALSTLTAGNRQITVRWTLQKKQASGYQLEYATKKSFEGAKRVTVNGAKVGTKTLKKLKARTRYYVRVRTWHKVKGKTYYSAWSKAKSAKTK